MKIYTCAQADSLNSLSRRFRLKSSELAEINFLSDRKQLTEGLPLYIPSEFTRHEKDMELGLNISCCSEGFLDPYLPYLSFCCPLHCSLSDKCSISPLTGRAEAAESLIKAGVIPLLGLSNLSSGSGYSGKLLHSALKDRESRALLRDNLIKAIEHNKCLGLQLEFYYVPEFSKAVLCDFIEELSEEFQRSGLYLLACIGDNAESPEFYKLLNHCCHRIILNSYDFSHILSPPGPVCHIKRLEAALAGISSNICQEKLLIGISDFALDYTLPWVNGSKAEYLSVQRARSLAVSQSSRINFNADSGSYYFNYRDFFGKKHIIYYNDLLSLNLIDALIQRFHTAGLYIMRPAFGTERILWFLSGKYGFTKYI